MPCLLTPEAGTSCTSFEASTNPFRLHGLVLQAEQLEHWQRNRRQLAFSTVGTPDYIAPEVRDLRRSRQAA